MDAQLKKVVQQEFNRITSEEIRNAYSLSRDNLTEQQRRHYDLEKTKTDNLKISAMLDYKQELKLSDAQVRDLEIRQDRNRNFELINEEKWTGDSSFMKKVKDRLREYEGLLREEMDGNLESAQEALTRAMGKCDEVIAACSAYLNRGKSIFFWRRGRYDAVEAALQRFQTEKGRLTTMNARDLEKHQKDLKQGDTLLTLINQGTLAERARARHTEQTIRKNQELKNLCNEKEALKNEERDRKYEVIRQAAKEKGEKSAVRTPMAVAGNLALLKGYDDEQMKEIYFALNTHPENCTKELKRKRIRIMEDFFAEILKYDMQRLDFKQFKDLYGDNFRDNSAICLLAMDCENYINEYKDLLQSEDKNELALNEKQFAEVMAKRDALQSIRTMTDKLKSFLNEPDGEKLDLNRELSRDLRELEKELGEASTPSMINAMVSLVSIREMMLNKRNGKTLYGPGVRSARMLRAERAIKGLTKEEDHTAAALAAIEEKKREEKKVRKAADAEKKQDLRRRTEEAASGASSLEKLTEEELKAAEKERVKANRAAFEEEKREREEQEKKKAEEAKKKAEEEEKRKAEEEKRKAEEEKRKAEEEKRKAELRHKLAKEGSKTAEDLPETQMLEKLTEEELKAAEKERVKANRAAFEEEKREKEYRKTPAGQRAALVAEAKEKLAALEKDYGAKWQEDMERRLKNIELQSMEKTEEKKKQEAKENTRAFETFVLDYDRKEKAKNDREYKSRVTMLQAEVKKLLSPKKLSEKEFTRFRQASGELALRVHARVTDHQIYARNAVPMELKKKLSFQTLSRLSAFVPMLEQQNEASAQEIFKGLVKDYGEGKQDRVLDQLVPMLESFAVKPEELFGEGAFCLHLEKYSSLSDAVKAFRRFTELNPAYLEGKPALKEKLEQLIAVSDYVRVKKQLLLSPAYKDVPPLTLGHYPKKKDVFRNAHYRRLLMVSEVMERNMRKKLGLPLGKSPIQTPKQNTFAEEDRQYALRLSTEEGLRGQVREDNAYRLGLLEDIRAVKEKIAEAERELQGQQKEKAADKLDKLKALKYHLQNLLSLVAKEEKEDPEERIKDALTRLEEERFHVPMSFQQANLDNIPEKREGKIMDVLALVDSLDKNATGYTVDNAMCRHFGFEQFEQWIGAYKQDFLIYKNQLGNVNFQGVPKIKFTDNLDRIITHFKGSFHLGRTDAEMREQLLGLSYSASQSSLAFSDDPEAIAYQKSVFDEMALKLSSQTQAAVFRNLYGGLVHMLYMTPADRRMAVNVYQKMDCMAAVTTSNITDIANQGMYTEYIMKANQDGSYIPLDYNTLDMGSCMGALMMSIHGCIANRGFKNASDLTPKQEADYTKFVAAYKKKHPKAPDIDGRLEYLFKHPELWATKAAYLKKDPDPERELEMKAQRRQEVQSQFVMEGMGELFGSKYAEKPTHEQLQRYKQQALKEGYEKYDEVVDTIESGFAGTDPVTFAAMLYDD